MAPLLVAAGMSAAMASTVSSVVTAVTAIASVAMAVVTPMQQAKNKKVVAEANARFADQNAKDVEVRSGVQAARRRRMNRTLMAEQEASAGEAGVFGGTSLDLLNQNSVAMELDALNLEFAGDVEATSARNVGAGHRATGANAMAGGRTAAVGAGIAGIDPLNSAFKRVGRSLM